MRPSRPLKCLSGMLLWAGVVLACGCGKDVSEIASSVKDAAKQGLDKARETAGDVTETVTDSAKDAAGSLGETMGMAGSFELNVGQVLRTEACYARCIALGADRPAVLQLQSYQQADKESFPSVFAQAKVTSTDVAALPGQTVEAQLFIKLQQNAATLYTREAPVQLKITVIEEGVMIGEIVSGSLTASDTSQPTPVSGSFRGVIQ